MKIGAYVTLSEIGRGGVGVVYRARSPDGRAVALKLLLSVDAARLSRFERERRLIGSFTAREGFVPLLDSGSSERGPFLVMPFVTGGTLRARLESGPLGVAETVSLGVKLARALGRAHERGVVHRDLKPENIIFTEAGEPLVADLGLAKHFDALAPGASRSVSLSAHGALAGTAGYMPPEQLADAKTVGPEADVFALGAILHECLAGRPAFEGESILEIIARVTEGRVAPLSAIRKDVPASLVETIERALAPDARARFADGHALSRALEEPARRRGRRSLVRAAVAVTALVGLAAAGLGVAALRSRARLAESRRLAALGANRLEQKDYGGALEALTRAIELAPGDARVWSARGRVRALLGDGDAAIADGSRAIDLDPRSAGAYYDRAHSKEIRGDVEGAIADYTNAIGLDRGHRDAWFNRALLKARRDDVPGAVGDFAKVLELDPRDADAWYALAGLKARQGDQDGAIAGYTRTIVLDPRHGGAWHYRGTLRAKKGDLDGAIADFTNATDLLPSDTTAWVGRAHAKEAKGDLSGSIDDLTAAIVAVPTDAYTWTERGRVRFARSDYRGTIVDCTRAIELAPGYVSAWDTRGCARIELGELDEALADLTKATDIDPHDASPLANRGHAKLRAGDRAGALADYRRALVLAAPDFAQAATVRAEIAKLEAPSR